MKERKEEDKMKVAYIRVSTIEQNTARQEEAMKGMGIEKTFIEKASAKDTNRPQLLSMIDFIREGDVVYVESFSRLARSTEDLLNIVKSIQEKGATIISLKEKFDLSTPTGKLMLTMMGAISTFEREVMLERQREGIAIAKAEGKYKGRRKIEITPEFVEAYKKYMNRELTVTDAIKELGIKSRTTWYKLVEEYKAQQEHQVEQVEEEKKQDLEEWIVPAMTKLTKRIKKDLGINILDKKCGADKINRTMTDISIEYVFDYEGKTYMFEYLRNLDKIEVSILQK